MRSKIRVLVADDHDVVIEGIRSAVASEPDIVVIQQAVMDGQFLLGQIQLSQPDVLLLDAKMPNLNLIPLITEIRKLSGAPHIIIVTAHKDHQLVQACADAGASGFLLKEEALLKELPHAIRTVAEGRLWFSPKAQELLLSSREPPVKLTQLQYDILNMMMAGLTPAEIAQQLGKKPSAVYALQSKIRDKLGAETNEQAIITAIERKIITLG